MNTKAIITNYIRSSFPWNAITLKNFASCTNAWAPLSKIDIKHTTDEAEFRRTVSFNKSTSKANIGNTNQTLKSEIKVSSPSIDGKITAKLSSRHLNVWLGLISSSSQAGPSSFSGKVNCTSVHGNSTRGNFGLTNVRVNPQLVVKPQNPAKAEAKPRFAPISSKVSTHTADSNLEKPTDTYSTNDNVNRTFPTHSRNHKRRFTDTFEHYQASYSHQKCVKPTIYGPYHLTANKIYQIWQCIPFNVKIQRMPDDIWSYFPRFSTLDAEIVEEFNSQDLGLLFKRLKWNLTVSEKYFLDKGFKLIFDRDSQVCGFAMTQYHQFRQIPIYTIYLALIRALIMARFHLQDPLKKHHNSKSWKFVFQSGSNVRTLEMSTGSINRFYRYVDLLSDLVQSNEFEFENVKRIMNQQKSVKVNIIAPMKSIKDVGLNTGCWNLQDLKIQEETPVEEPNYFASCTL
ncbi:hypothetical protein HK098_002718 [Nowakowskiella sp. JEL0407]|nr:hypothetical protein HK098_002718 [Nowakowskiella sp. JEL0407]